MDPEGGSSTSTESATNSAEDRGSDSEMLPYANWASEVAASSQQAAPDPLPENVIRVMGQVFQNDMLLENILEKIIWSDDRATMRACRLVSKQWVCALAKLYKKLKKPQFIVCTCKESIPIEPRIRPMFEQHTLLYDFTKTMLRHDRIEGFIPTFSLQLGTTYFRKSSYNDFVSCLIQCGASLVELYLRFPKNSTMSFLLPPGVALPNLYTFGVSFTNQTLLPQPLQGLFHFHAEFYPNHCGIHLVQALMYTAPSLRRFHFLHSLAPTNPPDLENLYLPDTLTSIRVETPLREFDLLLRRNFPCLTELFLNATVSLYSEEQLFELFTKLSRTLRHVWLTGPPLGQAARSPLTIRLPRMENVLKFVIFKPWEFEKRTPPTIFDDVFPNLKTLVFANQSDQNFQYLMSGMRSTSVTSFSVWLTSSRPGREVPIPLHLDVDNPGLHQRYRLRLRQIIEAQGLLGVEVPDNGPPPPRQLRERMIDDALGLPNDGGVDDLFRRVQHVLGVPRRAGGPRPLLPDLNYHQQNAPAAAPQGRGGAPPQGDDRPPQMARRGRYRIEMWRRVRPPNENPHAINQNDPANRNPVRNGNGAAQHEHEQRIRARLEEAYRGNRGRGRGDQVVRARRGGIRHAQLPPVMLGRFLRDVQQRNLIQPQPPGNRHLQEVPLRAPDLPAIVVEARPNELHNHELFAELHRQGELRLPGEAPVHQPVENARGDFGPMERAVEVERVDNNIPVVNELIDDRIQVDDENALREGGDNQDVFAENGRNDPAERGLVELNPDVAVVENEDGDVPPEQNEVELVAVLNNGNGNININARNGNLNVRAIRPDRVNANPPPGPAGRPPGRRNPVNNEPILVRVHPPQHHQHPVRIRIPLPDRPVTMTKEKLHSVNLAFPNLVKLTVNISGPGICGMKYIFQEMKSLQNLRITVENSLWSIHWDSLLTGISPDFCEAVRTNAQLWDDVYMPENHASIRSMINLKELCLLECQRTNEPQSVSERCISDVAFHFALLKMKTLKHLTVTTGFTPSQTMARKWHEEKGYFVKVERKPRLDSKFYESDLID